MSNEAMAIALHHSRSSGTTKLVLLGIANHDGDGGAWPSLATLATYAGGVSERTVSRAIGELVELGEVSVERNAGGLRNCRDDRRPNLYHFLLSCPPDCDGSRNHRVRRHGVTPVSTRRTDVPVDNFSDTWDEDSDGVTLVTERVDTGDIHGVTPVSTEPVHKNQSIKGESHVRNAHANEPVDNFPPSQNVENEDAAPPPLDVTDPRKCIIHQGIEDPPPCHGCKNTRERWEIHAAIKAREVEKARKLLPMCPIHSWAQVDFNGNCGTCRTDHRCGDHHEHVNTCEMCWDQVPAETRRR